MKKLVVMLVTAMLAIVASAASYKWSAANLYAANGTDKYSGSVTLYAYLSDADASTAKAVSTVSASAGAVPATTFNDASLEGGKYYNFFLTFDDSGKTFTSTALENKIAQATGTTTLAFGNMQSQTQNASNWANVPEPTSALLLVLGVAGLALKRKRA